MSDQFNIVPYTVRAAGTDVPPEQVQAAINSLAQQTTLALNVLAQAGVITLPLAITQGGTGQTTQVAALAALLGASAVPIANGGTGQTTQAAALVALLGSSSVPVANGGTGATAAPAARTNLGLGSISTQAANNIAITGGTVDNTPIGQTTPAAVAATTLSSTGGAVNGTLGATTPNTAKVTTLQASGLITPTSTVGIAGTTTNDAPAAGSVGEVVTATAALGSVPLTTSTNTNLISISLTAGDWDVFGCASIVAAGGGALSNLIASISTTSVTLGAFGTYWQDAYALPTSGGAVQALPQVALKLTATTTVYVVAQTTFSTGTASAGAVLTARRRR